MSVAAYTQLSSNAAGARRRKAGRRIEGVPLTSGATSAANESGAPAMAISAAAARNGGQPSVPVCTKT